MKREPSKRRRWTWTALGFLMVACVADVASAQVEEVPPPNRDPSSVRERQLLALRGNGCAVRFTPGFLDRADHLLRRLEVLSGMFRRWSEVPVAPVLLLYDRDTFEESGLAGSYALPQRTSTSAIFAPAGGDAGTVDFWRRLLGVRQLPMAYGTPIVGSANEAASMAIADLVATVQVAESFVPRWGLAGDQAWVSSVVAHLAALSFFDQVEAGRSPEIMAMFEYWSNLAPLGDERAFRTELAMGSEADQRLWLTYQGQFHSAARAIYARDGRKSIKKLKKLANRSGGQVKASDLLAAYPAIEPWHRLWSQARQF